MNRKKNSDLCDAVAVCLTCGEKGIGLERSKLSSAHEKKNNDYNYVYSLKLYVKTALARWNIES